MSEQVLERTTFKLSREIEFFTKKELEMQIGHGVNFWYIAIMKELIDNALDACETGNISPEITVNLNNDFYEVQDNGPGLPDLTVRNSLNYLLRVSDKQYYVSPTRGQMGNALKCIWAAPYVATGKGTVEIWAQGLHHTVQTSLDRIAGRPQLNHGVEEAPLVKIGTRTRVWWPNSACSQDNEDTDSYNRSGSINWIKWYIEGSPPTPEELVWAYSVFNPHATFNIGETEYTATIPDLQKWQTDQPTSPHWYNEFTLRDLVAAYVSHERDNGGRAKTVRDFVSEFRGLSSTAKQKRIGFSNVYLHDLVKDEDIDIEVVRQLLGKMKDESTEVKPEMLGILGEEHFRKWLEEIADLRTFNYRKRKGFDEYGMPYNCEVVFATKKDRNANRTIITGTNWTPTLGVPIDEIRTALGHGRVDDSDPVIVIVHVAKPRFEFLDRGKTRMAVR